MNFVQNARDEHDYGQQLNIPAGFGDGEFTLELSVRLDDSFPVGPTVQDTPAQLVNWTDADPVPYTGSGWWARGNFLLDGHVNGAGFINGTFSLQVYGGGRLRCGRSIATV